MIENKVWMVSRHIQKEKKHKYPHSIDMYITVIGTRKEKYNWDQEEETCQ